MVVAAQQPPEIRLGHLTLEGRPTPNGAIQLIVRSERGQQELFISFTEWTSLAQVVVVLDVAGREMKRLHKIEKIATLIGEHWREQHGVNAGLLDLLAEVCRHG